jgi:hypothetical protein
MTRKNATSGFVAIITVLIIGAVCLAIVSSVALLSIGEGQSALAQTSGEDTLNFVEGCVEDGLLKSRASASYTGGTIARPEGTCSISISKAGSTWTMTTTTTATKYVRTIVTVFTRASSGVTLTSWREQ